MEASEPTFPQLLRDEFLVRRAKNPAYSLRAFARALGIGSGRLSEFLSGRRRLTEKTALKVSERLGVAPKLQMKLISELRGERVPADDLRRQLSDDEFCAIADWEHFAILSLIATIDFDPRPVAIARRLGISAAAATKALGRLKRLNLIAESEGAISRTCLPLQTTHEIPSAAIRRSHRQSLERAIEALDAVPLDRRDITSITLAFDPADLVAAKAALKRFRRHFSRQFATERATEVYELNLQLVPVTRRSE